MNLVDLKHLFKTYKETSLFGRYICQEHIQPLLKKHKKVFEISTIGTSVLGNPIDVIKIGIGPKKILMWSQMHGNETTTTKAIFDLLNVFSNTSQNTEMEIIIDRYTIAIIPMLNPDGAKAYTRLNANHIDLNRDAQELTQPESVALRTFFNVFKPDVCFNLHGQRTIFSAGSEKYPATVSFLAPAQDIACSITETRKRAMELIVKINENLQLQIPHQVGVYDDAFNLNCVGDTFQSLEVPTLLFEAGHFAEDYDREVVREFMFQSLLVAIHHVALKTLTGNNFESYFNIPGNEKLFSDIIIRNATVNNQKCDVSIQFLERLVGQNIEFIPIVDKISDLSNFFGHREVDVNGNVVFTSTGDPVYEGYENDFVFINNEKFTLKP